VLALRMGLAFPLFMAVAIGASWKKAALTLAQYAQMAALGFVGYYLSSLANFWGLQFISVGLERMILYSYPSMVIVAAWVFWKKRPERGAALAAALAYAGICLAFIGEAHARAEGWGSLLLGSGLVLCSAITYAVILLLGGKLVHTVGALRFTSLVSCFSCLFVLLHFSISDSWSTLVSLSGRTYALATSIALLGTVAPALLLGIGLKRAGPVRFAIMASVGPVLTVVLGWLLLDEQLNAPQALGFLLCLGGGLMAALKKGSAKKT
jgi:drug/metabolite transporter (DMT)-like permease